MMKKTAVRETVLYYTPGNTGHTAKLKGVLVRMGIRIKNVSTDQIQETVGYLAGVPGFDARCDRNDQDNQEIQENQTSQASQTGQVGQASQTGQASQLTDNVDKTTVIPDEMLVMHQFSSRRIDELLLNLRKAGVPKIALKAIVTEHNCAWTFYQLYQEIKEEHEKMQETSH